jgi:hypothetical protein
MERKDELKYAYVFIIMGAYGFIIAQGQLYYTWKIVTSFILIAYGIVNMIIYLNRKKDELDEVEQEGVESNDARKTRF